MWLLALALLLTPSSDIAIRDKATTLKVQGSQAQVSWKGGSVVYSRAINARPPIEGIPQIRFLKRYGATIKGGSCVPGPPVAKQIQSCRASDGSFWATQLWRRLRPNYGGLTAVPEVHISHWSGETAKFEDIRWDTRIGTPRLCGRLTYRGQGVYGFKSTSQGNPLDDFGRNVYLDALDSDYGPGWRRVNSFLANAPDGHWCYLLWPHGAGSGKGASMYRITAQGPGVTPIIRTRIWPPL